MVLPSTPYKINLPEVRREQVPDPRNVSDRFSEIWGPREKAGNVTNQKLWNVPQISNSVAAVGELFNCVFDVYLYGELCYSFSDAGNAIKKEKPSESSKGEGYRLA